MLGVSQNSNKVSNKISLLDPSYKSNTRENTSKALKTLRSQSRRASINLSETSPSAKISPKTFKFKSRDQGNLFFEESEVKNKI